MKTFKISEFLCSADVSSSPLYCFLFFLTISFFTSGCEYRYSDELDKSPKKISLTFDDGPDDRFTTAILDILREKGVKATFFLIGDNMERYPEVCARISSEGHWMANHTTDHIKLPDYSFDEVYNNIMHTESLINSFCGESRKLFRPPFGMVTQAQRDSLTEHGFKIIMWNVESGDVSSEITVGEIIYNVVHNASDRSVILMHCASPDCRTSRRKTVRALPEIIDCLKVMNYYFVAPDEL